MQPTKTIVVTGGNRGIGLEICRQLAEQGHRVVLASRDLEKGRAAAASLRGEVVPMALDLADPNSILAFAARLDAELPHLDVLVNNAGIIGSRRGLTTAPTEEVLELMQVNSEGPLRLTQLLLPLLHRAQGARIVNVSSLMGQLAALGGSHAAYRLSKAAMNAWTIQLAGELQAKGISVNAMCPGWVQTEMGGKSAPRTVAQGADTVVWLATAEKVPTGKFLHDRKVEAW
jgi:NAD(P)-dependent dehydrogenase (short-subunit alcohol dehydrogenase family)